MFVGDELQITASPTNESFTWTSEDPSVATVGATGDVRAVGVGETNIVVSNGNNQRTIPVKIIAKVPVTGISLSVASLDLQEGETASLRATLLPENNNEKEDKTILWQSSDPSIATVTDGVVKAVGKGYASISAMLRRDPSLKLEIPVSVYQSEIANVVFKKPVTESDFLPPYIGQNAVDGDKTTNEGRWVTMDGAFLNLEHWIEIDLEDFFTVGAYQLWRMPSGGEVMRQFSLQVWIDGAWATVASEDDNPAVTGVTYYKEFEPVTTNKVRWYLPAYTNNRVRLFEIEVYSFSKIYE